MSCIEKLEGGFALYLSKAEVETLSMIVANCYAHNNKHIKGFSSLFGKLEELGHIQELAFLPQGHFQKLKENLVVNGDFVHKILKGSIALSVPEIEGDQA